MKNKLCCGYSDEDCKHKNQSKHTPAPWKVKAAVALFECTTSWCIETENGKNTPVSAVLKEEDAAFIVRAVNAHEELLAACKLALERWGKLPTSAEIGDPIKTGDVLYRAITKAEGK